MTADQVRKRIAAIPYRRFELRLADGRAIEVDHPDLLAFDNGHRVVIVSTSDEEVEVIDLMLVLSIRFHEPDFLHPTREGEEDESDAG